MRQWSFIPILLECELYDVREFLRTPEVGTRLFVQFMSLTKVRKQKSESAKERAFGP